MTGSAAQIVERLEQLGRITDEPGVLTRTFLSPAMREANAQVETWMREAGMATWIDPHWGNIVGRLSCGQRTAKTLLLGSHLDTVRNAGRYDGPMGVLLAIAVCAEIRRVGVSLPFHVDVIGFSDEEGVRFHSTYLGSKAMAGLITSADLKLVDAEGMTLAQAAGNPAVLPQARYVRDELLGYVEVHIEQGPALEASGHALGVVTAIAAQSRCMGTFTGRAGHAGTTPMPLRRDALAGAAEFIGLVEKEGRKTAGLVATVGQMRVVPNVSNVIPGQVELSLDVRHEQGAGVEAATDRIEEAGNQIAERRNLHFSLARVQSGDAVPCDSALTSKLADAVKKHQPQVPHLPSGAGHDGVILSRLAPIAMLFVRCREGLSHHPDEHVEPADIDLALRALVTFIKDMA
jgi:allantoate deiminase